MEENFVITYEGPAVDNGRMRVNELAPALLALADAIREAQALVAPNQAPITLEIKAGPREGSYLLDMVASDANFIDHVVDLFSGSRSNAAVNLGTFLTWVLISAGLIKKMFGKNVESETVAEGQTTLELSDGTRLVVPAESVVIYKSVAFRTSVREFVAPIERDGIEQVTINYQDQSLQVASDEVSEFDVSATPEEEINDNEREVNLHLLSVAFEHGKWRVTDGTTTFFADIADQDFVTRVARNEAQFASGDRLKVVLRHRQFQTNRGLHSEYTVTRVLEHVRGGQQLPFDFTGAADPDVSD